MLPRDLERVDRLIWGRWRKTVNDKTGVNLLDIESVAVMGDYDVRFVKYLVERDG